MTVIRTCLTAGLISLTLAGALAATAPAAEARDDFWAGVAAGAVGGIVGGAIANQPRGPVYHERVYIDPPPPPPVVYHQTYYQEAPPPRPRCHYEWRENDWGDAFRVKVCPAY
ncbi:hypothetical protein ACQKGC_06380 [Allorhizobium pseudoryzae]|uniref:hypothetical protein n=1 Tax=Allorhizobium pseudoryzae TaxID=379684 RepID=UPI003D083A17